MEMQLTQVQLAERSGVAQATISKYESDPETKYRAEILYKLAAALLTSPDYLLHGTGPRHLKDLTGTAEELKQVALSLDEAQIALLVSLAKSLQAK